MNTVHQLHKKLFHLGLAAFVLLVIWVFYGQVIFGFSNQSVDCLYADFFIINKQVDSVKRNELAVFNFEKETVVLKPGDKVIKIVAAIPGDTVSFNENALYVNGERFARAKSMQRNLRILGHTIADYQNEYLLKEDEYFMVGETLESFDSRYWGPIKKSQIEGEAYAIY